MSISESVLKPVGSLYVELGRLLFNPKRLVAIYKGHMGITFTRYMAYRVELVIWLVSMIMQPVVFMTVWSHTSVASADANWTDGKFATYFILSMMINHLTMAWVMWEWESRVKTGELSYLLLRPQSVIHRDLGENLTFKFCTFPVMFFTALGLCLSYDPVFTITPWAIAAFALTFVFTFALRFLFDWLLAILAMFTVQVMAVNVTYIFLMLLFSGQIGPLELLPQSVQTIADFLPFKWMVDFPIRLLMGELSPAEAMVGIMHQLGWIAVVVLMSVVIWKKGVKKWSAVGL